MANYDGATTSGSQTGSSDSGGEVETLTPEEYERQQAETAQRENGGNSQNASNQASGSSSASASDPNAGGGNGSTGSNESASSSNGSNGAGNGSDGSSSSTSANNQGTGDGGAESSSNSASASDPNAGQNGGGTGSNNSASAGGSNAGANGATSGSGSPQPNGNPNNNSTAGMDGLGGSEALLGGGLLGSLLGGGLLGSLFGGSANAANAGESISNVTDQANPILETVNNTTNTAQGATEGAATQVGAANTGDALGNTLNEAGVGFLGTSGPDNDYNLVTDALNTPADLAGDPAVDGSFDRLPDDAGDVIRDASAIPGAIADDLNAGAGVGGLTGGLDGAGVGSILDPVNAATGNAATSIGDTLDTAGLAATSDALGGIGRTVGIGDLGFDGGNLVSDVLAAPGNTLTGTPIGQTVDTILNDTGNLVGQVGDTVNGIGSDLGITDGALGNTVEGVLSTPDALLGQVGDADSLLGQLGSGNGLVGDALADLGGQGAAEGSQPFVSVGAGGESAAPLGLNVLSGGEPNGSVGVNALDTTQPQAANVTVAPDGADGLLSNGLDLATGGEQAGASPLASADVGPGSSDPTSIGVLSDDQSGSLLGLDALDSNQPSLVDAGVLTNGLAQTGLADQPLDVLGGNDANASPLVSGDVLGPSSNPINVPLFSDGTTGNTAGVNAVDSNQPTLVEAGILPNGDQLQFPSVGGGGADSLAGVLADTAPQTGIASLVDQVAATSAPADLGIPGDPGTEIAHVNSTEVDTQNLALV